MKKALRLMMALLFFAGMANAQQITINFEDGTIPASMTNDATYPWTVINILSTTNGQYCIQSGNAGVAYSESSISYQMSYTEAGYIMFDANCMGEGYSYDVCQFFIDGSLQFEHGDELKGWHTYGYNVPAGAHTFTWTYSKDGTEDPTGDGFQVDNIIVGFGAACVATDQIQMTEMGWVSWNGMADSYTLRYKKGTGSWQTITGITDNYYDLTSLGLHGDYKIEVKADCNGNYTASGEFHFVESYENWFAYVDYASPDAYEEFYHFRMDDLSQMTSASNVLSGVYDADFIDGYVWMIRYNGSYYELGKAPVNIWDRTIGDYEVVNGEFSNYYPQMAYNPANGLLYFMVEDRLKSINPAAPTAVTDWGSVSTADDFVISNEGQAYAAYSYYLYTLNLSTLELTDVDGFYDGAYYYYMNAMAFDRNTGELFGVSYSNELYYIDPATANVVYVGTLGAPDYYQVSDMFMTYDWDAVSESNVESVNLYPNPAQGQITVEGTGLMVVSNVLGQEILSQEIEGKATIELPKGMYIVRLNNAISKVVVE